LRPPPPSVPAPRAALELHMTLIEDPLPREATPTKSAFWRRIQRPVDHRVPIPSTPLPILEIALDSFLEQELEHGTWEAYRRTFSEASRFASFHGVPLNEHTATLWLMAVHQEPSRRMGLSALLTYAKHLSATLSRSDEPSGELRTVMKILVKLGANVPEHQALPVMREEIYNALEDRRFSEEEKMLLYVGWKSAARASDLQHLDCRRVFEHTVKRRRLLILIWVPTDSPNSFASGRLKHARGRPHACVLDCGMYTDRVVTYIRNRRAFTTKSTREVSAILERIRPGLTAHSLKRGALCYLVEQGTPVQLLVQMARHRNPLYDLPQHTQAYLPLRHLALLLGTQEATRIL
jgi:hypothetical protein